MKFTKFTMRGGLVWTLIALAIITFGWMVADMPWWMFVSWVAWLLWAVIELYHYPT